MAVNHAFEAAADNARRFWQQLKQQYQEEGQCAPAGSRCPYARTSFAALHWQRGHKGEG